MTGMRRQTRWRSWNRRLAAVPVSIWSLSAMMALLLFAWSLLAPIGRAPDEPVHADLVDHMATQTSYPDFDGRRSSEAFINVFQAYKRTLTPENAPPRGNRDSFEEWGGANPTYGNQQPQHPPLYYWAVGSVMRLERVIERGSDAPLDRQWTIMRLLNAAMIIPLPGLTWLAARRLGLRGAAAAAAAAVPLSIPQLSHIGASVNNDNLLTLLSAAAAVSAASILHRPARVRTAATFGALVGLALMTKAFAVVLLPWMVVVFSCSAWKRRHLLRETMVGFAVASGCAVALGTWFYVRSYARYGEWSPSILDSVFEANRAGFDPAPTAFVRRAGSRLPQSFWGDFGFTELPLDQPLIVIATAATLVAAAAAFWPVGQRVRETKGPDRWELAAFASLFVMLVVVVAARAYPYDPQVSSSFLQGRYLYGSLVPFAVVVGYGATRLLGRAAPLTVLGVAVVMQSAAIRLVIRDWWAETDASVGRSVDAFLAWSPFPAPIVVASFFALVVATVATFVHLTPSRLNRGIVDREAG